MTTPLPTLHDREWQILALLANGKSNKAIAHELFVSVDTVEKQLTQLYRKLAVTNRAGAITWYWTHKRE